MADARIEAFIELRPGTVLDAVVPPEVEVRQRLPPLLAIVAAPEGGLDALRDRPEVRVLFTQVVPPEALARLAGPERLFAAAWNERRRPKERRGDGLPWDSPGFDAP